MKTLTILTLLVSTVAGANFSTYTTCFNRMYRDSMMSFGFKKGGNEYLYLREALLIGILRDYETNSAFNRSTHGHLKFRSKASSVQAVLWLKM